MSEWKAGAAKRRDARQAKGSDEAATLPAKKDTKRWCKGKVGREHQTACVKYTDLKKWGKPSWRVLVCKVCGKELATYWPWHPESPSTPPPPDWVTS